MPSEVLAEAQRLYGIGELEASEAQFRLALHHPADAAAALYGLGMIRYSRDDLVGATSYLRQSLDEEPHNPHALYYLGNLAAKRDERAAAISLYAEALVVDPRHAASLAAISGLGQVPSVGSPSDGTESRARPQQVHGSEHTSTPPATSAPDHDDALHTDQARGGVEVCRNCGAPGIPSGRFCDRCGTAYAPQESTQPAESPVTGPPRAPADASSLVGVAVAVQQRVESYRGRPASMTVLDLRIEPRGRDGRAGPAEAVHMRGMELRGSVAQGDWVEVPAKSRTPDGYRPKRVRNLTTGSIVEVKKRYFLA